jgi:hypothetical protein
LAFIDGARVSVELPSFRIEAGELLQHVSRIAYRDTALYFGRDGTNRYDAPARDYGVLYLGMDLPTALMESVFHTHHWDRDTRRSIALAEVQRRLVRVVGALVDLCLADLTAEGVMAGYFGLNLEQMASRDYTHMQRVSAQVFAMTGAADVPLFDGVLYPSRNNYPGRTVALFDRAGKKVTVVDDIDLVDHVDWPRFVEQYGLGIDETPIDIT